MQQFHTEHVIHVFDNDFAKHSNQHQTFGRNQCDKIISMIRINDIDFKHISAHLINKNLVNGAITYLKYLYIKNA